MILLYSDQRFEGGANMWHQSMNKSFLDRHNSVLNVAHSEPLRHGTVKDAVRLFLGGGFFGIPFEHRFFTKLTEFE